MEAYLVGGAVRDALMGLPIQDRDWVVVGATPEQLLALGFTPVGRDFPVFLHPQTREEYALARTERNTARGYRGFAVHAAPDVTLQEDLARRDLTINSIAIHADLTGADGQFSLEDVVDPYGGQHDIASKVLRHVTPAFREDPVRILRLARFAARFPDFAVAAETLALMRAMVNDGETDHLVPERVWQELARGLMEKQPSRMFAVLRDCGALAHLWPELDHLWDIPLQPDEHPETSTGMHVMRVLDIAAQLGANLPVRFACLTMRKMGSDSNFLDSSLSARADRAGKLESDPIFPLRIPNDCRELAALVAREHDNIQRSLKLDAEAVLQLLERCDAIRKPERFAEVLLACECDARGHLGRQDAPYPQRPQLQQALHTVLRVATNSIAGQAQSTGASGPEIGRRIRAARLAAVAKQWPAASPGFNTAP